MKISKLTDCFQIVSYLKTEDKEYRTCFACHQLLPVKRMEQHHFPIPKRYEGLDTIWLCLSCHDFVDRITIGKWPEHFLANAMNAGKEHKLLLLKLWSVYTDLRFGNNKTKEGARVIDKLQGEPPVNSYGAPVCHQCGDELECPDGGDWHCVVCEVDETDYEKSPRDLSLSHTQLWILANIWLSLSQKQKLHFCMEYKIGDIVERDMDAKAKGILAITHP